MKRLNVLTVVLAMILAPAAVAVYAQDKIPLTEEQLVTGKLPQGIINVRTGSQAKSAEAQIPELKDKAKDKALTGS